MRPAVLRLFTQQTFQLATGDSRLTVLISTAFGGDGGGHLIGSGHHRVASTTVHLVCSKLSGDLLLCSDQQH